jgi:DNA-binding IclR family transcriptional regulator
MTLDRASTSRKILREIDGVYETVWEDRRYVHGVSVTEREEPRMSATETESGAERFSRIFDVLELLVGHPQGMTLTEIVKRLGLPTSSAHNLLQRMAATDVVAVTEDLRYSVGSRAVRLGIQVVDRLEVRSIARRALQELARETGEDIYLAVRLGNRVTYVERVAGTRAVTVDIRLGQSLFLHATSVGKLFAAHNKQLHRRLLREPRPRLTPNTLVEPEDIERELSAIRDAGYSVSREEAILGIVGIAVPVHDAYGTLVAAIHISALRAQLTKTDQRRLLDAAMAAATAIEKDLGRVNPSGTKPGKPTSAEAS